MKEVVCRGDASGTAPESCYGKACDRVAGMGRTGWARTGWGGASGSLVGSGLWFALAFFLLAQGSASAQDGPPRDALLTLLPELECVWPWADCADFYPRGVKKPIRQGWLDEQPLAHEGMLVLPPGKTVLVRRDGQKRTLYGPGWANISGSLIRPYEGEGAVFCPDHCREPVIVPPLAIYSLGTRYRYLVEPSEGVFIEVLEGVVEIKGLLPIGGDGRPGPVQAGEGIWVGIDSSGNPSDHRHFSAGEMADFNWEWSVVQERMQFRGGGGTSQTPLMALQKQLAERIRKGCRRRADLQASALAEQARLFVSADPDGPDAARMLYFVWLYADAAGDGDVSGALADQLRREYPEGPWSQLLEIEADAGGGSQAPASPQPEGDDP